MQQKVVIIGHSYTSRLGIIRSISQLRCEIALIVMTRTKKGGKKLDTRKPIDCYSKYVNKVFYCARMDSEGLIKLLLEKCIDPEQKVILIPDSDFTVAVVDNHQDLLKKHFLFPHIHHKQGAIQYWMDKSHQKQLAKEIGLNVAKAQIIDITDGQYTIPDNLDYPCYCKPLATLNGGKGGMRRCGTHEELVAALSLIIKTRTKNIKVLVEDYKEIDKEFALLGFSDGKEVFIPGIIEFLRVSKQNKGIALQGMVKPITGFEELIEKFKQLVLQIGFVGVFDIDFYNSDGIIYFCELNLRFGGSGYAFTRMGCNLPAMMIKHLIGEDNKEFKRLITANATYTNDKMCFDDWTFGHINLKELRKSLHSSDIRFIPDPFDKKPEKRFKREIFMRYIKKIVLNNFSFKH